MENIREPKCFSKSWEGGGRELPGVQYRGLFLRGEGEGGGMIVRMRLWRYIILNVVVMRNPKTELVITSAPINH